MSANRKKLAIYGNGTLCVQKKADETSQCLLVKPVHAVCVKDLRSNGGAAKPLHEDTKEPPIIL